MGRVGEASGSSVRQCSARGRASAGILVQGPRGIMPNPKSGNITNDVTAAFTKLQAGQVAFKTDKVSPCHMCTRTGLTPPTSAPALGSVTAQCLGALAPRPLVLSCPALHVNRGEPNRRPTHHGHLHSASLHGLLWPVQHANGVTNLGRLSPCGGTDYPCRYNPAQMQPITPCLYNPDATSPCPALLGPTARIRIPHAAPRHRKHTIPAHRHCKASAAASVLAGVSS